MAYIRQNQCGLIILGNSGVGKSFLANLFLQTERFDHRAAPRAVTTTTESGVVTIGDIQYIIFNIPGLIEAKQERIDTNKEEIHRAFAQCPNSVVFYVFGNQNGRIRNEDIIAFQALNEAYPFDQDSLVFVMNTTPIKRDNNYEGETMILLEELLQMSLPSHVCFLDTIDTKDNSEKDKLLRKLLAGLQTKKPKVHTKKQEINLQADQLKNMQKALSQQAELFQQHIAEYEKKIENAQEVHRKEQQQQAEMLQRLMDDNRRQQQEQNDMLRRLEEKHAAEMELFQRTFRQYQEQSEADRQRQKSESRRLEQKHADEKQQMLNNLRSSQPKEATSTASNNSFSPFISSLTRLVSVPIDLVVKTGEVVIDTATTVLKVPGNILKKAL